MDKKNCASTNYLLDLDLLSQQEYPTVALLEGLPYVERRKLCATSKRFKYIGDKHFPSLKLILPRNFYWWNGNEHELRSWTGPILVEGIDHRTGEELTTIVRGEKETNNIIMRFYARHPEYKGQIALGFSWYDNHEASIERMRNAAKIKMADFLPWAKYAQFSDVLTEGEVLGNLTLEQEALVDGNNLEFDDDGDPNPAVKSKSRK
jgi:hypothetical protein